jgi:hypothetical protein
MRHLLHLNILEHVSLRLLFDILHPARRSVSLRSLVLHSLVTIFGLLLAQLLGDDVERHGLLEILASLIGDLAERALATVVDRLEGVLAKVLDDRVLNKVLGLSLLMVERLPFTEGRTDLDSVDTILELLFFRLCLHFSRWSKR